MRTFRYYYHGPVAKWVRRLVIDFANWFKRNCGVDHQITIRVYANGYLDTGNGLAYGCFARRWGKPCIWLATWWYFWRDDGVVKNRDEAREEILDCLVHEFAEYDKWRRGVPNNHRGIQRRVDFITRQFSHERRLS